MEQLQWWSTRETAEEKIGRFVRVQIGFPNLREGSVGRVLKTVPSDDTPNEFGVGITFGRNGGHGFAKNEYEQNLVELEPNDPSIPPDLPTTEEEAKLQHIAGRHHEPKWMRFLNAGDVYIDSSGMKRTVTRPRHFRS